MQFLKKVFLLKLTYHVIFNAFIFPLLFLLCVSFFFMSETFRNDTIEEFVNLCIIGFAIIGLQAFLLLIGSIIHFITKDWKKGISRLIYLFFLGVGIYFLIVIFFANFAGISVGDPYN